MLRRSRCEPSEEGDKQFGEGERVVSDRLEYNCHRMLDLKVDMGSRWVDASGVAEQERARGTRIAMSSAHVRGVEFDMHTVKPGGRGVVPCSCVR